MEELREWVSLWSVLFIRWVCKVIWELFMFFLSLVFGISVVICYKFLILNIKVIILFCVFLFFGIEILCRIKIWVNVNIIYDMIEKRKKLESLYVMLLIIIILILVEWMKWLIVFRVCLV